MDFLLKMGIPRWLGHFIFWSWIASALTGCELSSSSNSTFSFWCDESLCDWQVAGGEIRAVETWHPADTGVELVTDGVSISQEMGKGYTIYSGALLSMSLIADIHGDATLWVELDEDLDGIADQKQAANPNIHWDIQPLSMQFQKESAKFRVILRKSGAGRVVLGKLSVLPP